MLCPFCILVIFVSPTLTIRYDLDNSGTLNSIEELHQLVLSLTFKLNQSKIANVTIPPLDEIKAKVNSVGMLDDNNGWKLREFRRWYLAEICPDLCPG